ncbi:MAG: FtsW/RodA/SpoVE family cell cycle protein [Planctomycetes bacterium]|nr:FtsW/RodA/SpoVE family cell cycle protein [Planctomycetota bacterium]
MKGLAVFSRVDPWPLLAVAALALCGLMFIGSATMDDAFFGDQQGRQALFLLCSVGLGTFVVVPHYVHYLRASWVLYAGCLLALVGLFFFAPEINGSRRWYALPGFSIQPAEFTKLGVVMALAALLRFKSRARTFDGLIVPMLVVAVPALLIMRQPDLGSSLVLGPILLAMCYAAGASARSILCVLAIGAAVAVVGYFWFMHGYQQQRVQVWLEHWSWTDRVLDAPTVRDRLRGPGYQPWQALIALGGGGLSGFGLGEGPQNRYDFLPYRSEDYVFAVIGEEVGWLGCLLVIAVICGLVVSLLQTAQRTRERFGRLVCVGVAAWIGSQSLLHIAVCGWLIPATGLPMPLVSYGGSSALAAMLAIALCANISARREPILASDGFD